MLSKYVFSDLSREYWLKLRYDNQTLKNFKLLRDVNNKTGKALQKRGLVTFVIMVGWIITPAGLKVYRRTDV